MRVVRALLTFLAVVLLADWLGTGHQWHGLVALTALFLLLRIMPEGGWRWLLGGLLWLSVAIGILACVQIFFMDRARGPFASPNFLGSYAVLMLFLGSQTTAKWQPLPVSANLLAVLLSQSRGSIIALAAGLLVMLWRRRPVLAVALVLAAIFAVFEIRPGLNEARLGLWRIGLLAAAQRPLLGWGQGGLMISGWGHFYNLPLDWALNAGILGLMAGAWLLIEAWIAAKENPALRGFLVAWFVNGLVIFQTPATLVPFFVVLAYISRRTTSIVPNTATAIGKPATIAMSTMSSTAARSG